MPANAPASPSEVGAAGACVGCGACSYSSNGAIAMMRNEYGAWKVDLERSNAKAVNQITSICPFSRLAKDETELGSRSFAGLGQFDPRIGFYSSLYAGRILDDKAIVASSSGGLTTWLLEALLQSGRIDGVVHVGSTGNTGDALFEYRVSRTVDELHARKKSIYYSVQLADVLREIRDSGGRYAIVGVPCFMKAIALLMQADAQLSAQVAYRVGLVCGHMKSSGFAEGLAWQAQVSPDQLKAIDFRLKVPGKSAARYDFAALDEIEGKWRQRSTIESVGGDWGHGMFQLSACDYCDDIFAETADICFGDAWLPRYNAEWRGTNIIVSRSRDLDALLQEGVALGRLTLDTLSPDLVSASQGGNFRHRWDGLSVRLEGDVRAGKAVPLKRIAPGSRRVSRLRRSLIRLRRRISQESHQSFLEAKRAHDLGIFLGRMTPMMDRMRSLYRFEARIRRRRTLARIARLAGLID